VQCEEAKLSLFGNSLSNQGLFSVSTSYDPKTETINIKGHNHHPQETFLHPLKSSLGPNPTEDEGADPEKLPLLPTMLHHREECLKSGSNSLSRI